MSSQWLISDTEAHTDGIGSAVNVTEFAGRLLVLTLEINRVVEQEALEIVVFGSEDGEIWSRYPLVSFPRKSYCGVYSTTLNLNRWPDTRYLRVEWKCASWRRSELPPLFSFSVVAQPSNERMKAGKCLASFARTA